eukprot:Sdes_comp20950_c0_seq1m18580
MWLRPVKTSNRSPIIQVSGSFSTNRGFKLSLTVFLIAAVIFASIWFDEITPRARYFIDPHANWRSIFIQRFLDQQRAKRQRIHFSNPNSFDPSFMSPRIPPQIPHHHFPRSKYQNRPPLLTSQKPPNCHHFLLSAIGGDYDLFPEVGNFPGMPSQGSSGASSGWQGLSSRPTMPKNPGLPFFHP